jgi:hypothetical protein
VVASAVSSLASVVGSVPASVLSLVGGAGRVWWGFRVRARLFRRVLVRCVVRCRLVLWLVWGVRRAWMPSCGRWCLGVRCFRLLPFPLRRFRGVWSCVRLRWCGLLPLRLVVLGAVFLWFFPLWLVLRGLCRPLRRRFAFVAWVRVRGLRRRLLRAWVCLCWCSRLWVFRRGVFPRWAVVGFCCLLRLRCSSGGGLRSAWGTALAPAPSLRWQLVAPPRGYA